MAFRFKTALAVSLLAGAAAVPATAQQNQPAQGAGGGAGAQCAELHTVADEQEGVIEQNWLDRAREVAAANDAAVCDAWLTEARTTLERVEGGEAAEMIEGRIVVRQPDPQVTVQQAAPQIEVTQPEPEVAVTQGQPEIIVRQARPTVRIQMPQPTVTIDQPQPEIIVRMPDPEVQVSQADPEVQVRQAQPQVEIEQGEAEVDVQLEAAEATESADVQVQQGQPVVQLQETGDEPQVRVDEAQPRVSYEAAEPIVEIEGGGEPQVQFTESGEPNVQFLEEGDELPEAQRQAAAGERRPQAETAQADGGAQADADWRGGREAMTAPEIEREGYGAVAVDTLSVDALQGSPVHGPNDENIATISELVLGADGQAQHFLMDVGGFLGIGARTVAVGFDEATILRGDAGDHIVYVSATREQLEALPEATAPAAQ